MRYPQKLYEYEEEDSGEEPIYLTEQEWRICSLMLEGCTTSLSLSRELSVSEHTIKNHLSNMFKKLNIIDRVQLILAVGRAEIYHDKRYHRYLVIMPQINFR